MKILVSFLTLTFALALATPQARASYILQDIGVVPNSLATYAKGLNQLGHVTGYAQMRGPFTQGFVWRGSSLELLNTLGGDSSWGASINDAGQIAGFSGLAGNSAQHATIWTGSALQDLGTLSGAGSRAYGINSAGQVTGSSLVNLSPSPSAEHAYFWNGSAMQDLGTLGGRDSVGLAINDSGHITGRVQLSNGRTHAFLWNGTSLEDLGSFGSGSSQGLAINNSGQVTGASFPAPGVGGGVRAFFWDGSAMRDLGSLVSGESTFGRGINNLGYVVGDSGGRAFLWDGSTMLDLTNLVSNVSGWTLESAVAINDAGQIAGWGTLNGSIRPFLLTPDTQSVAEPSSFLLAASGLAMARILRRRRAVWRL
jgi:probable HAF family extracellular repeat protein